MVMKAICYHDKGHRKTGIINLGGIVPVVIECNNCKEEYYNCNIPTEDGAVAEMLNNPYEININGFKIE